MAATIRPSVDDYAAWFAEFKAKIEVLPAAERQHSSLPILHQWAEPTYNWENERVDATQFRAQVQQLKPGGDLDVPHLSEGYIHKYLRDMQELGLITRPPQ